MVNKKLAWCFKMKDGIKMNDKEKTIAFIFGFLTLLAIINWLILAMIKISRGFFWLS